MMLSCIREATRKSNKDLIGVGDSSIAPLMCQAEPEEGDWYRFLTNSMSFDVARIRVEFLARRLLVTVAGCPKGAKVFVGTPLYVAQTDDDNVH
jgi:hypothetical protein